MKKLEAVVGNCHALEQCIEVLRRMDDETYATAGAEEAGDGSGTRA